MTSPCCSASISVWILGSLAQSLTPCYRFQRHFAQMLHRMGLASSAVNDLSSLNICVFVIGVLFLLVFAMVTLSRL